MDIMEFLRNQIDNNWTVTKIDGDRIQLSNHEYTLKIALSSDGLSANLREFILSQNPDIKQTANVITMTNGFVAVCEYIEPFKSKSEQYRELQNKWFDELKARHDAHWKFSEFPRDEDDTE